MKYLLLLLCVLSALCGSPSFLAAAKAPNIVFILADDLGWSDLGCTGSSFYETPNLDRLAKGGVRFTSAYAACPVCSPTRAAIMTGLYTPRTGVTDYLGGHATGRVLPAPFSDHLNSDLTTIPQALKPAGYASWHVGKWHLGGKNFLPQQYGFDAQVVAKNGPYYPPYKTPTLPDGPKGEYLTDRLTDEAITLLKNRDPNKPFFLNLWYTAPHTPLQAPEALVEKYRKKARDLGIDPEKAVTTGEQFPTIDKAKQRVVRRHGHSHPVYAAMIESLDTNVGRVLKTLDELNVADDTLVVFTSDNGGLATAEGSPTSNEPLRDGKGWMYEGGTRVAMIVRWPGVAKADATCDTRVISTDYLPTFVEVALLPAPVVSDGRSLVPLLKDPAAQTEPRTLFWHYPHYGNQGGTPGSSVLAGDFKLIERFEEGGSVELYNLKADPNETRDIAKENPDKARALRKQLEDWRQSVGAKVPQPNPAWAKTPRPEPVSARPGSE